MRSSQVILETNFTSLSEFTQQVTLFSGGVLVAWICIHGVHAQSADGVL